MSLTQTAAALSDQAIELLEKFNHGEFTQRNLAVLVDLYQRYIDYLDEVKEDVELHPTDETVIVKIYGVQIKFKDEEHLAEYLSNIME